MTGINDGFPGKGENLFPDAGKEQLTIPAGQVPSAHAIGKENIPAKELVLGRKIETETSRAVAGDEKKFGAGPCFGKRSRFPEEAGGVDRAKALGQAKGEHGIGFKTKKGAVRVVIDRATSPLHQISSVPDMIPMPMGKQQGVWFDLFFFQKIQEALRCIDGETMTAEVEKVSVGGGEPARKDQGFRHGNLPVSMDEDED